MWWKEKNGFWRNGSEKARRTEKALSMGFLAILLLTPVMMADLPHCFGPIRGKADSPWMREEKPDRAGEEDPYAGPGDDMTGRTYADAETEYIAAICHAAGGKAGEADPSDDPEMLRPMILALGERGYAAVDQKNQINMTEPEQVCRFVRAAETGEDAVLTVIVVAGPDTFTRYRFCAENGKETADALYCRYDGAGRICDRHAAGYASVSWRYTSEGYFLFEGSGFSDMDYLLTLSAVTEHIALRVEPLEEICREYNRRYILPVGYGRNNLFLTDWSEEDFGEVNFQDLFDIFYGILYGHPVPWTAGRNAGAGVVWQIPEEIFYEVLSGYFCMDRETLRSRMAYSPASGTCEYRPRGFSDTEYPDIPYPEVIDCEENKDKTITLLVQAVYPHDNTSRAFLHRVVIRPLADGSFQYVSNHMLSGENPPDLWWHSDRSS